MTELQLPFPIDYPHVKYTVEYPLPALIEIAAEFDKPLKADEPYRESIVARFGQNVSLSIIRGFGTYGNNEGLWEMMAFIDPEDPNEPMYDQDGSLFPWFAEVYDKSRLFDDPVGWATPEAINEAIQEFLELFGSFTPNIVLKE